MDPSRDDEVMATSDKKGLSIERDTYLLREIVKKLISVSEIA
jgi:hypothetical protein